MPLMATRAASSAHGFGRVTGGIPEPSTDPFIANVLLLMHFEGANNSTNFVDEKGHAITRAGSPTISTAGNLAGTAAGLFNGTTDYLTLAASTDWVLPGDFTIEGTYSLNVLAGNQSIIGNYTANAVGHWMFRTQGAAGTPIWYLNSAAAYTGNAGIGAIGQKRKFAMVRAAGVCTLFIDGVVNGTPVNYSGSYGLSTLALAIGAQSNGVSPAAVYIDEIRITKDIARYTSTYAPRVSPFPNV